ncbi:hypothetical protein [Phaeocystidibacter luteus]|uniref:Uncharacterized protein n=1 Tax=Phaeocystidibacter luteus TaxID=911197 RepID=A0A6N6RIY5_9FLAO|nr:hypothetical protein [Phaeocystidibacter luteus]KAB2814300.1 hypothetical protein F8C67_00795 [Phaeocystidibacter luteus]
MKRIVPILLVALGLTACEKARELTQFTIETNTEFTIPAATGINLPIDIITPDVETNSSNTFENNNTRADLIEEVRLDECDLTITAPGSADFDFLKSIEIFIKAENEPEVLLAERQDIPDSGLTELSLDVTGADLTPYLKKSEYDLRVKVVTDQVPGSDIDINIESIFFVDAKIFGL